MPGDRDTPDEAGIRRYMVETLDGVDVQELDGDSFYFYDPGGGRPVDRRLPFSTLVTGDRHDQVSDLDRPGVFRVNIGVSKRTFQELLGDDVPRTEMGGPPPPGYDFTALDTLMPHPVYGSLWWVCVLNPGPNSFETVQRLLTEAHALAAGRYERTHRGDQTGEEP